MTDPSPRSSGGQTTASRQAIVTEAWSKVPAERRQQKRFMTLLGILVLEVGIFGGELWGLSWMWRGWCLAIGGHMATGDYRRLVIDRVVAAAQDVADLAGKLATAALSIRTSLASIFSRGPK